MRVCYTCVNRHYLTISKGLLVLWSVLGWLSLHPQRVQCVSSVAPEATGRGSRFPSGHRGLQGGHRGSGHSRGSAFSLRRRSTEQRCRPRCRRHVGSRAGRHLVAGGRRRCGHGAAPAEGALLLLLRGRNISVSKCCSAVSIPHL